VTKDAAKFAADNLYKAVIDPTKFLREISYVISATPRLLVQSSVTLFVEAMNRILRLAVLKDISSPVMPKSVLHPNSLIGECMK
jgi:hypothetical protein